MDTNQLHYTYSEGLGAKLHFQFGGGNGPNVGMAMGASRTLRGHDSIEHAPTARSSFDISKVPQQGSDMPSFPMKSGPYGK